ncbi:hypothetical protein BDF20DRAFT_839544 [Mycotypha africana]|uniref:uncharacterized protein n=1 Tax=Mycotypha africana TaxID=64632 RepID=UPI0023010F1F|nr:uncharacterized protein BDF20DRAFT_839544 [Mycotypha africana]KAI8968440.1 hypothetical protein BDF20DRAFT_839544 [Mycotypha africana]
MTDPTSPCQPNRLKMARALTSTTAIQTLEITTTAVVTGVTTNSDKAASHLDQLSVSSTSTSRLNKTDGHGHIGSSFSEGADNDALLSDLHRTPSVHHHHHHVKTPAFEAQPSPFSTDTPLPSPTFESGRARPRSTEVDLPSPLVKSAPSEAVAALQLAADEMTLTSSKRNMRGASNSNFQKSIPAISASAALNDGLSIFDSSFFSEALLIQWSYVMGPKVEKVWSNHVSVDEKRKKLRTLIARQILNGEVGRNIKAIAEPKWIVLSHRHEAIVCAGFLFYDPTIELLCALVFVVPVRYLRNFSRYFQLLCDRIPLQLVEPLIKLRKVYQQLSLPWSTVLNHYQIQYLIPFVKSIMDLESVSLPIECVKV